VKVRPSWQERIPSPPYRQGVNTIRRAAFPAVVVLLVALVVWMAVILVGLFGPPNCYDYDSHRPERETPSRLYPPPWQNNLPPCVGHET